MTEITDENRKILETALTKLRASSNAIRVCLAGFNSREFDEFFGFPRAVWGHETQHEETSMGYWQWVATRLLNDDSVPTPGGDDVLPGPADSRLSR